MPKTFHPWIRRRAPLSFLLLIRPLEDILKKIKKLKARGNKPLKFHFEHMLNSLIYFHLQEHSSGCHLVQALSEDNFAKTHIAPPDGISKGSFFEALNNRGLQQMIEVFSMLQARVSKELPSLHCMFGELVAIDGSLIDCVMSMDWADYSCKANKAKVHVGFDVNRGIPSNIYLTEGNADERPFVPVILSQGQTGLMDRLYQKHKDFDQWQRDGRHFICRIKDRTEKTLIKENKITDGGIVFYDALALLGKDKCRGEMPVRVVGYRVNGKDYWVATNRHDLTGEEVADAYKLRWNIETFFGWWKQHLKVYHLIARSRHGLMMQMLGGLITYLLLALYCHKEFGEKVSITRVRELRFKIDNEREGLGLNELFGISKTSEPPYASS